jgi:hypothetical protein
MLIPDACTQYIVCALLCILRVCLLRMIIYLVLPCTHCSAAVLLVKVSIYLNRYQ